MAIQKILKTYIICPAADKEKVMERLQFWGNMEIIKVKDDPVEDDFRWLSDKVHRVRFIVKFLNSYAAKESVWQKLKEGIPSLDREKARAIERKININGDYESLNSLDKKNKDLDVQINLSLKQIETLNAIKGVDLSKSEIEFNTVSTFIVRLKKEIHDKLRREKKLHLELLCDLEIPVYAVIYHKKDTGVVEAVLNKFDIKKEDLPGGLTPSEEIDELKNRISKFEKEKKNLYDEIKCKFLSNLLEYKALLDIYENKENLKVELNKTSLTEYTSLIIGWIPKNLKTGLIRLIKEVSTSCHMEFYVPVGSDSPPVLLKNSGFSHPFEVVTDLYGTPEYNWIDPTPYLAPFFAFFFGLCITDAGYGIIITAVCLGAIKKFKISPGAKKFLKLLMWGGVASIFTGILTGGWFGNILKDVRIVKNLTIMNPLENPQYFLYFSILLGFIQVLFGIFLSMLKKIKEGEVKGAFFEDLPWIGILIAIPLFVSARMYFKMELVAAVSLIVILLGVIGVVGFSSYKSKNVFSRIGGGLYNLYGGTDYFKDMISYSRLFALGMGTGILAMAINEISLMALDIPVLGYLLVVVIFTCGHIFNILMNILSGYVHSSRLQYVEFFSRFFRGGGRSFDPFIWKGKNISLKA